MESHQASQASHALAHSLRTIRAAKTRFRSLMSTRSTPAVLVTQIELCDVLLEQIREVSCSLERRISGRRVTGRRAVAARRKRHARSRAVSQRSPVIHSKRKK